jgi:hypothetical protein
VTDSRGRAADAARQSHPPRARRGETRARSRRRLGGGGDFPALARGSLLVGIPTLLSLALASALAIAASLRGLLDRALARRARLRRRRRGGGGDRVIRHESRRRRQVSRGGRLAGGSPPGGGGGDPRGDRRAPPRDKELPVFASFVSVSVSVPRGIRIGVVSFSRRRDV